MATDFVHTAQVVDAVIAELQAHLPAAMTDPAHPEYIQTIEHGDLRDYAVSGADLLGMCPAILVRGLGTQDEPERAIGTHRRTAEAVRIVHIRLFDQCYDDAGSPQTNMSRARERYAKLVNAALWADPHRRLANPTLTATGGTAGIAVTSFGGWDLGHEYGSPGSTEDVQRVRQLPAEMWAIACTISAEIRTS